MLPLEMRSRVGKFSLSDVYECLVTSAAHAEPMIFDEHTEYINFKNIAYNWITGKTTSDRQNLYFRYALTVDYPTTKSTGAFKKFMKDVFKDDTDTRAEFYKFLGLCISDIRHLKLAYFLFGPANTGKTVVLNLLQNIIGKSNTSTLSFSQMDTEFAIHLLHGRRLNISGEVSGTTAKRLDAFKSITGNDTITTNRKNQSYLEFKNRCILVFGANTLPLIKDKTEVESFVSRLVVFPFSYPVPRERWDNRLLENLMEDISGIIEYSVEGLRKLAQDGYVFKESSSMKNCKRQYANDQESFTPFMKKYIVADSENRLPSSEIAQAYRKYCELKGYTVLESNVWSLILMRSFPVNRVTVKKSDDTTKRIRAYAGINFSNKITDLLGSNISSEDIPLMLN